MDKQKNKVGEFRFVAETYQLDFQGRITIPMIGDYLLQAASTHAADRGFGYDDMTEKRTAWVLSRLAIEVLNYPTTSQNITVYTWIDEVGKLFTSRCFELADESGKTFGYARSIWAAIDMETRRPTMLDVEGLNAYITDRPCPIEKPGKITPVETITKGEPYQVKYSDIDINGHFNSIKYMEHLLDMFDLEMFQQKNVSRFEIAYQAEGRYGMPLELHKADPDDYTYNMAISNEGKAICRAAVTWK